MAARRLRIIDKVTVLDITAGAEAVANELVKKGHIPVTAAPDAFHIGAATVHEMDVLLT